MPLASHQGLPRTSRWQNKNLTAQVVGATTSSPWAGAGGCLGAGECVTGVPKACTPPRGDAWRTPRGGARCLDFFRSLMLPYA